jgi:phospholipid-translocating ATPase
MAVSQFFNELKVGFLFSYVAPLAFVLFVTLIKEGIDDFLRYKRDKETNNTKFKKLTIEGKTEIKSEDINIGDIIEIHQNEKVPADMIILKSFGNENENENGNEKENENDGKKDRKNNYNEGVFIRTDQLDGETDWKLRKAPPSTQKHETVDDLLNKSFFIVVDAPHKNIYDFNGVLVYYENKEDSNLGNFVYLNLILSIL